MSDQPAQEKTEKATPHKQQKSKREGQTVRAKEFVTALIFIVVGGYFFIQLQRIYDGLKAIFGLNFQFTKDDLNSPWRAFEFFGESLGLLIDLLIPIFIVIFFATLLGNLIIGGWIFNFKNVHFKTEKLNPFKGLKRMFSSKSLAELIKSIIKVSLIATILYLYLASHISEFIATQRMPLIQGIIFVLEMFLTGILMMGAVLIIVGILDIPYQKYEHNKQLKMTKHEVKEEMKQNDGKPEVKQKIRQLQQQFARRQINKTVPDANVVITNPTHYAVAIKYDPSVTDAPYVVAKGIDETALYIQKIAKANAVEVIQSAQLARSIYHTTHLEQKIPNQLFTAVAHILAYILQLKSYREGKGNKPLDLPVFHIDQKLRY